MTAFLRRSLTPIGLATALFVAPVAGCSADDSDDAGSTTSTVESTTTAPQTSSTAMDQSDDLSAEGNVTEEEIDADGAEEPASRDFDTVEIRDRLNEDVPELGALFDWDAPGGGTIGINFLGTQKISLYADEIDAESALAACEAVAFVFERDPEAVVEVISGSVSSGTLMASRTGDAGTCAAG